LASYVKSFFSIQEGSQIYLTNYQPTKSSLVRFRHAAVVHCRRISSAGPIHEIISLTRAGNHCRFITV